MTFDLKSIQGTRDKDKPPRILLYGQHKVGKSTFSSQAPSPVFIQTESGLGAIDTQSFPLCLEWNSILEAVSTLYQEKHKFQTVVLDSGDWAQTLAYNEVCSRNGVKGIESIGYGKGYTFAADLFKELLDGFDALRNSKNMAVIIVAHAEIRRFDDPTTDAYDRWQVAMQKGIGKMVQEWADVIGFAQIDVITKVEKKKGFTDERTRALTTGQRVLRLCGQPSFEAGNRYGLPDSVPLVWADYQAALDASRK